MAMPEAVDSSGSVRPDSPDQAQACVRQAITQAVFLASITMFFQSRRAEVKHNSCPKMDIFRLNSTRRLGRMGAIRFCRYRAGSRWMMQLPLAYVLFGHTALQGSGI